MNIHEYQAKAILEEYGIPISGGEMATTPEEAREAAQRLMFGRTDFVCVVKAQIHAGGRGKAGGVILCRSEEEVVQAAQKLLGMTLVTHQTGSKGQLVRKIFIECGSSIAREFYLSLTLNRQKGCLSIIASASGGMDIEHVAATTPGKIINVSIDPAVGIQPYHARRVTQCYELSFDMVKEVFSLLSGLYQTYIEHDADMIEINPLILSTQGHLIALDAKISFDDNSLFRQQAMEALRDEDEEDPLEIEAKKYELNYIKLDGSIGCMVNGAGLAMATMDIIKLHGAEPANFLDVGGGATKERVAAAFRIITSDPGVQAILINIFGGIMRCDIIAEGIVAAVKEVDLKIPMVVRLQGTNRDLGNEILAKSGVSIIAADDLNDAAMKVVQSASKEH